MKSFKSIITALIMLSITVCNAQIKNLKTENVQIYGNCGMCETTIEKAGNLKNVTKVDWDKDSKMATIQYDSVKTNKNEILKRIALAGYDSETFLAPNDTYAALPGCCQYDRSKEVNTDNQTSSNVKHSNHSEMNMSDGKMAKAAVLTKEKATEKKPSSIVVNSLVPTNPLQSVYNGYFALKDALVSTDANTASQEAKSLAKAINDIKMNELQMDVHMVWMKVQKDMLSDVQQIEKAKDIAKQRAQFISLSENMYQLMKVSKDESPIYYQFCPMANKGKGANWLSKDNVVKNPYYGSQMLNCGKVVETIE